MKETMLSDKAKEIVRTYAWRLRCQPDLLLEMAKVLQEERDTEWRVVEAELQGRIADLADA